MTKSESKYVNTAYLMDQAFIELLNKKEYEFITVKEICEKAGVNRSTFYLHYETIGDLLDECIENTNKKFLTYFEEDTKEFINKMENCSIENLILITPEYLTPYLNFIKENKVLHQVSSKNVILLESMDKFNLLNKHIFTPIFNRFKVDQKAQGYIISYYINGITAIVNEWIKNGCKDEIPFIEQVIIECVRPYLVNKL